MKLISNNKKLVSFIFLLLMAVIWIVPVLWATLTSFKSEQEIRTTGFEFLPEEWVTTNYVDAVMNTTNAPVLKWFFNSMVMSTSSAVLSVIIVSITAYGYARLDFKGRDTLFLTIMGISLFPGIVNLIPMYSIIATFNWVNSMLAIIVPGLGGVTNIFLVRQFMLGIPKEFDEAAKIDGANEFQIFLKIIVPLVRPVLTIVALFSFTGTWNDFLWPAIVFNDIDKMPITAGLELLQGAYGTFKVGLLLSSAIVAIIPTFILFLFAQKYFMESLSLSAGLKG